MWLVLSLAVDATAQQPGLSIIDKHLEDSMRTSLHPVVFLTPNNQ
jgi:hypothetical protein